MSEIWAVYENDPQEFERKRDEMQLPHYSEEECAQEIVDNFGFDESSVFEVV